MKIKLISASCSVLALTICSSSALAQNTAEASGGGNTENATATTDIIVTAQKRAQSINDVGLTIQAASQNTLSLRGISSPSDLAKLVPGFSFTQSTYSTPVYTLRGIGLYDATFGATPAVAIYTDQIPRNFPVMSAALNLDLERVEVLKGPQGTLFGQSSTGGAINYITAKPTNTFAAGGEVSYERFGKLTASGFISGPLSDTLKVRLAGRVVEGGDWQYSLSRRADENGAERKLEGRLIVDWEPSDRFKIQASATGVRDHSDVQAPQYVKSLLNVYSASALATANNSPATANPFGVVDDALYASITTPGSPNYTPTFLGQQDIAARRLNGSDPALAAGARAILGTPDATGNARAAEWTPGLLGKSDNPYYQFSLRADYKLDDNVTLTSVTAYARQGLKYAQDLDGTTAISTDVPLWGYVRSFNQELRLSGNSRDLNWIIGGSFDSSQTSQNNYFYLFDYTGNLPIPGLAPIFFAENNFDSKLKTYAGFGNVEFKVTPQLTIMGGLRYTENHQKARFCYNDPAIDTGQSTAAVFSVFNDLFTGVSQPPIQPGECFVLGDGLQGTTFGRSTIAPIDRELKERNWSFRVGANYKFDQGTLIYATISQGYKAGIFSSIGASSSSQYAPAAQEKVVAYEAGFKAPLANRRLNVNGAVFYYDYSNKQVRGRINDNIFGLLEKDLNVPKSYVWGIEGEIVAVPMEGLTLAASATYLKAKVSGDYDQTPDGLQVYNAAGYTGNFRGSPLPFTPEFSGNVDIQYEHEVGNELKAFVGGTVLYQGKQNTTFHNSVLLAPDFEIKDYATLDLRAGVSAADGSWRASVFGRNVLDKYYTTGVTTYLDTILRYTGRPATYGVTISFRTK